MAKATGEQYRRKSPRSQEPSGLGPHSTPIRMIHRTSDPDAWVTFALKGEPRPDGSRPWIECGGIRAIELESLFPEVVRALTENSYFSLNSMFRRERPTYETLRDGERVPFTHPLTGLPPVHRSQNDLRYLNAFYVDLDEHNGPCDLGALVGGVVRLQKDRKIPPASMLVHSGRGLWVLWLIRNPQDEAEPQRAWPEKIRLYVRIQRAIIQQLSALGADKSGKDAARSMRVPGSINSDSVPPFEVKYWPQLNHAGIMATYTLEEMAAWFGLSTAEPKREYHTSSGKGSRSGWNARWEVVLSELATLREVRDGFHPGSRRQALFLYIIATVKRGALKGTELREAVIEFGTRGCVPPLSEAECLGKLNSTLQWLKKSQSGNLTHRRCADFVGVTEDEQQYLVRWFPRPRQKVSKKETRRAVIRRIVDDLSATPGRVPSAREMSAMLRQRGITASHQTVLADYAALGLSYTPELFPQDPSLSLPLVIAARNFTKWTTTPAKINRRVARVAVRQQIIRDFVAEFQYVPSVREMAEYLISRGCPAGRQTVCKDYRDLHYAMTSDNETLPMFAADKKRPRRYARFSARGAG